MRRRSRITSYNVCYTKLLRLDQFPAHFLVRLVNGDLMAEQAQLPGGREPAGPAADDRHPLAGARLRRRGGCVEGEAAEFLHRHRVVEELTGAGVHAEIGADFAADRAGEGGVVQDQFEGFLDLPLAQQLDALLGRDCRGAGGLAGGAVLLVLPVRDLQPVVAAVDQAGDMIVVVLDDVAEDAAIDPFSYNFV